MIGAVHLPKENPRRAFCSAGVFTFQNALGLQRRFGLIDNGTEGFGLMHGQIGQNLTVHLDTGFRQTVDETRVGQSLVMGADSGVDALDPQGAELALARLAVACGVLVGLVDGLRGGAEIPRTGAIVTFGRVKNLLVTAMGDGTTFGAGHLYVSQSDKGGLVFGGNIDYYNSYAQRGNLPVWEEVTSELLAMFPAFARLRLLRCWGGVMDMSMDGSPIITTGPLDGMYLNAGWCYGGSKATPASGWCFAHTIANDKPHRLNEAFTLERFKDGNPIDELGAGPTPWYH